MKGQQQRSNLGNKNYTIDYAVNLGSWGVLTKKARVQGSMGAFSPNRGYKPTDFTDGMSNTPDSGEVKSYTTRLGGSPTTLTFTTPPTISKPLANRASHWRH